MKNQRLFGYSFGSIYDLYVQKVERKGRTRDELDEVLTWLTGYDKDGLQKQIESGNSLEVFFEQAPLLHPNAHLIKGLICGVRVEDIEDPLTQKIRYMDKVVDELAKGKKMEKILRT